LPALADDSGLEVDALGGRPGVASARYGPDAGSRIDRLLDELSGTATADRSARFVCVVALALPGEPVRTFRGEVAGRILTSRRGRGGFGYDPVFWLPRLRRTMAQLSPAEKDRVSHRGRALARLARWLDSRAADVTGRCRTGSSPPGT
jgi:XTP/dITP diphosphohydrolase